MKIYIDFDDVICETARMFCVLAEKLFNIKKSYDELAFFNLQDSFELNDEQLDILLTEGHTSETLKALDETSLASKTINSLVDAGHIVEVVTGRPFNNYEASRYWLDTHGLSRIPLFHVDKYGRENYIKNSTFNMTMEEVYARGYDMAVDDSPVALEHLKDMKNCTVAVFNRPWNQSVKELPSNFIRCDNWLDIANLINHS